ncbi:MAG: tetratricopeptide repeat protein [Cytophagales bacterium]|nr:tetratricopeptide repeat protein [Cytophagales bacterium]
MKTNYTFGFLMLLLMGGLCACSQESNSWTSKAYHNTTAYYNAYFLADERMSLVKEKLRENHQDDYNRILPIFETLDTTFNNSLTKDLDYVGEKASFPIQFHKNSHWVDDSYLLLGMVRLYQNKPDLAIQTFRYVNYKSEDEPTRHQALYWLMRVYLSENQIQQASEVYRYLESKEVAEQNEKDFHMAFAHYHYELGEYSKMLEHVESALPKIKGNKDLRARMRFIAGQLHQSFNNDSTAYAYYKQALKGTPPYELTFFTKLNMAQVSSVDNKEELKKIEKYFTKLLEDLKNQEYRDRIYYEMARFELKQNHVDSAFSLINKSLRTEGGNPHQKGYTYWLAGKTRFKRREYVKAKAYYDSTFTNITEEFPEYEEIKERKEILSDFLEQYMIVKTEDSLQRMAKMDPAELDAYLEEAVKKEEERLKKEFEKQKELEKKNKLKENSQQIASNNQNTNFIFYNPVAMANAKTKFINRWGDRRLEDNWRRSNKETSFEEEEVQDSVEVVEVEEEEEVVIKVDKQKYYDNIPSTEEAMAKSNEKKMHALYELGKIYDLRLEEDEDAIVTFQRLQTEFAGSEYEAEVAYFLYLLCQKSPSCTIDEPKELLLSKYENSIYAKKVLNPNYAVDNESENRKSHEAYAQAFQAYAKGDYLGVRQQTQQILNKYPKTDIKDKLVFLDILTYAKMDQLILYKQKLIQFQDDFKTSNLVAEAQGLLTMLKNQKGNDLVEVAKTYQTPKDSLVHYFTAILPTQELARDYMLSFFDELQSNHFPKEKFETRAVTFDSIHYIITIRSFGNKASAKNYLKKLNHFAEFKGTLKGKDYKFLLFTKENYQVFIQNKNIDEYLKLYKTHY